MMCAVSLGAAAQSTVTYPYNPDGNADGDIAVGDLQDFLVTYGNPFSPSEIMVGDSSLTYWVEQLSQTIQEQQEMIDLLKGGDSRSLLYPDGLSGLLPIHHQFQQDGNFLIPPNKNLYITNYQGGSGDLFADNYLLISAPSNSPVKFSSPIKLASGTLITSTSFSTNDDSFVGFLVDRRVEPVTINIREESFTVPTGKYFVLNYFAVSEVGNSKLYVNGSETSTDANGGFGYWTHPSALTFGAGDILSPQQYVDNSQFNLFGYLVDEDYFDTPLQESEEPVLSNCFLEYGYEQVHDIPVGCDHVIVQPPTEVPIWEVSGFTPAGYTALYNVPLNSVIDTIISSQMSDVLEIKPYNNFMEINLSTAGLSEILIECGGTFDFEEFVLPTLLSFQIAIGDDNWICDNGVLGLPTIRPIDNDTGFESSIKFISQNLDFSTVEGLTGNQSDFLSGSDQMAKYRKSYIGRWSMLWSGVD